MISQSTEKNFVHCYSFFKGCQVFPKSTLALQVIVIAKLKQIKAMLIAGRKCYLPITYASNSCFILVNSSFVIVPSPSPNFCNFSRDASKSGLGGAGGI